MNLNPTEKEIDFINQALAKFNDEKVGPDNHELLNIVEYDENKNIIGGILGGLIGAGCTLIFSGSMKTSEKRESVHSY